MRESALVMRSRHARRQAARSRGAGPRFALSPNVAPDETPLRACQRRQRVFARRLVVYDVSRPDRHPPRCGVMSTLTISRRRSLITIDGRSVNISQTFIAREDDDATLHRL